MSSRRSRHCDSQLSRRARSAAAALTLAIAPALAGAQTVPAMPHEKYTLPNGLEVILAEDHSVPLVAVNTWFKVGSGDELLGRTGFAHLFEHIMFMGSENVPVGKFDQWLEAAGANNNGSTSEDRTNYYEWMPSNALPLALWLDADRMGRLLPTMDLPKVDVQRDVVKNERRQGVDNVPYGRADETILPVLFGAGHPYSWDVIGSMADLSAASLEDVKNFFRTYYAPNNATLSIVGDFHSDSVKKLVQLYFGGIPRGPALPPRPAITPRPVPRDTFLVLEDKVQLPRLYYSWRTVKAFHDDDASLELLGYVLAGDKNSRLYKRLVYDLQVAQDVRANQNARRLDGSFQIIVTPKPGHTPAEMAKLVNEEIQKLVANGATDRELARAQNTTRAQFLDRIASDLGKADQLNYYNYFVGTPDYARQDAARYDKVTLADIKRVATSYLLKPRVTLTVVPEGKRDLMVTGVIQ
ncbi:MAG TPA: pitrilysin family protein [Gemmatimonadaceae bacterium]|nr:pitrilysin family protein [Gemmatimonadaceae bacterium]